MEFPRLSDGQYAVLGVEVCTGIVLRLDRQRHLGSGEVWRVFESLEAARDFADAEVAAHPTIECSIHDATQQSVVTVKNEQYVADFLATSRARRQRRWWQFWKS